MPQIFTAEEEKKKKPLILLHCDQMELLKLLVDYYRNEFKIIILSKSFIQIPGSPDVFQVSYEKASSLVHIQETIEYSVFIATEKSHIDVFSTLKDKFKKDNTKVAFCIPVNLPPLWLSILRNLYHEKHIHVVFFGNIFGKSVILDNPVMKIFQKVISNRQVILSGNDLFTIYPISENDFLRGIGYVLFGNHKSRSYYLFYKHPQTIISAIHLLKRVEPDLEIVYNEKRDQHTTKQIPLVIIEKEIVEKTTIQPANLDHMLEGFEKSATEIINNSEKHLVYAKTRRKKEQRSAKNSSKTFSTIAVSMLIGFVGFVILNTLLIFASIHSAKKAVQQLLSQGMIQESSQSLKQTALMIDLVKPAVYIAEPLLNRITPNKMEQLELFVETTQLINSSQLTPILGGKAVDKQTASALIANGTHLFFRLQNINVTNKNSYLKSVITDSNSRILSLLQTSPEMLGYNKEQKYLLLLQNDNEVRPNGGFIGSVGELTLKNGQIEEFNIQDVYEIDGQLKGHIEPPFPIRRYIQEHLYLRDSNFNPDFEKSATSAAQIYTLATGKQIDGIIAVNTNLLETLLEITGPIELSQFNKTVTSKDASVILQESIQKDFFPGSTKKRDMLNSLLSKIIVDFEENPKHQYQFVKHIPSLLESKDIQLSSKDISVQGQLKALGFAGTFFDTRIKKEFGIYDVLGIYEANFGVNKVNSKVTRSVTYTASLTKDSLISKTSLTLKNAHSKDAYKTYIQFLVPKNSSIMSVSIDGKEQDIVDAITDPKIYESPVFREPRGFEVETRTEDNKTVFGILITAAANSESIVEIKYRNGAAEKISSLVNYSLLYVKQSGVAPYNAMLSLVYPQGYIPQHVEKASFTKSGITMKEKIITDTEFDIQLVKE